MSRWQYHELNNVNERTYKVQRDVLRTLISIGLLPPYTRDDVVVYTFGYADLVLVLSGQRWLQFYYTSYIGEY